MQIQIRPAPRPGSPHRERVVAEVTALERLIFGPQAWSRSQVTGELGPRRLALVATSADKVVGYVVFNAAGEGHDLHRIGVHPDHRGRGLARHLFGCADPGGEVLLEVATDNVAALGFYDRLGFERIGERPRYYPDGRDALVLRRPAAQAPDRDGA